MGSKSTRARHVVAALIVLVLGGVAYGLEQPVPVLDWFDLAVHEAGHLLAFPLPEIAMFLAGSVLQVAVPLLLAIYFWRSQRDRAAVAICLAWAGTSARDVAVYVADAPIQSLPLVGGGTHDWAFILGYFDSLDRADSVAGFVAAVGALLVLAGFIVAVVAATRRAHRKVTTRLPVVKVRRSAQPTYHAGDPWFDAAREPSER